MPVARQEPIRLIVFCGPPCAGKTTIAGALAGRHGFLHLQMDTVRVWLLPDSRHSRIDIDRAYQMMHQIAANSLECGQSVILDSTYQRVEQRAEVERIAQRFGALLHPIECRVPPATAVLRFRQRGSGHPALDLTDLRVEQLAGQFPYCPECLVLDTTAPVSGCLERCETYLKVTPGTPADWSRFPACQPTTSPQGPSAKHSR